MIDLDRAASVTLFIAIIAIAVGGIGTCGAWMWQDAQDKRSCRVRGGEVVKSNGEWRCAMPRREEVTP